MNDNFFKESLRMKEYSTKASNKKKNLSKKFKNFINRISTPKF